MFDGIDADSVLGRWQEPEGRCLVLKSHSPALQTTGWAYHRFQWQMSGRTMFPAPLLRTRSWAEPNSRPARKQQLSYTVVAKFSSCYLPALPSTLNHSCPLSAAPAPGWMARALHGGPPPGAAFPASESKQPAKIRAVQAGTGGRSW